MLEAEGFVKSILEPCWFTKRDLKSGKVIIAMVPLEVDDFAIASTAEYKSHLESALRSRFQFGKWAQNEEDFIGRHVKVLSDRIEISQEKYILENLRCVQLSKGRKRLAKGSLLPRVRTGKISFV